MSSLIRSLLNFGSNNTISLINIEKVVVLDTETGGLEDDTELHSIAAVSVFEGKIHFEHSLNLFIKNAANKPINGSVIHGITQRKLTEEGLLEKDVLQKVHSFIEKKTLVGHHIEFDLNVLNKHFIKHNLEPLPENNFICTFKLAKRLERPEPDMMPSYSLEEVCKRWGVPSYKRHTAAGDVVSNALLWIKLYSELKKRNIKL